MNVAPPRISVIVPAHNSEHLVEQTLASVLVQQGPTFELVVVDDGSQDGTLSRLRALDDNRLRVFSQDNKGAAAARNRGLREARGSRILFLDCDDLIGTGHLAALDAALGSSERDVATSRWTRFKTSPAEAHFPDREYDGSGDPVEWLISNWQSNAPMTQCGAFLIPRPLLDRVGGWDERLSLIDDFEFFARVVLAARAIRFAPEARLYYRSSLEGSLSSHKGRTAAKSQLLSLRLGTEHLLVARSDSATRRACANVLQKFEYEHYPAHPDLRAQARARVAELGGADVAPVGPPRFQVLRRFVGWRLARRVQRLGDTLRGRSKW